MKNYREGVKTGMVLCLKMFSVHPFEAAKKVLIGIIEKLDTLIDENGEQIPRSEETEESE